MFYYITLHQIKVICSCNKATKVIVFNKRFDVIHVTLQRTVGAYSVLVLAKTLTGSWECWCTPVILTHKKQRQEDLESEDSLSLHLETLSKNNNNTT